MLAERQQLEEDNEYGQILITAEVIMKNENDKRNTGNNKAHKTDSSMRMAASTDRSSQQRRSL